MAKRIMVVDDDEMNLKMAEFILKQKSYMVIKVSSGMECLTQIKKDIVDLILLDIEMPILNGMSTLEKLRETKEGKDVPVIFLTADADSDTVLKAAQLGAVDYIKKPFLPQDLLERVEKVLQD